jgi:hypothetical protein
MTPQQPVDNSEALHAKIDLLREALKPFADSLWRWEIRPGYINSAQDTFTLGDVNYLTVGDIKRAAKAYHSGS